MFSVARIGGGRRARHVAPAGGTSPYTWFSSLDLNTIPFHVSAGDWGSHQPVQTASAPTTTSTGTASNATQLHDALYTPGTQVTLTDVITGVSASGADITDVDVIIPPGTGIGTTASRPLIGKSAAPLRAMTRLRFRGETLGTFSGGQIHNLQLIGAFEDVIFDGVAMSGPGGTSGSSALHTALSSSNVPGTRLAIHNVRANCGGGFMLGLAGHVTVCNSSILTAQDTADPADAWGFRMSSACQGNLVFYGNDIRASEARGGGANNTFHRIRSHPNPGLYYIWISNNTFIDRVQSRILWVDAAAGSGTGTLEGCWFDNNTIVATYASGANGRDLNITDSEYARVTNNDFQSDTFTSTTHITLGAPVTDGDKVTGNTFSALPGSDPAWGAAGDPSGIDWTP